EKLPQFAAPLPEQWLRLQRVPQVSGQAMAQQHRRIVSHRGADFEKRRSRATSAGILLRHLHLAAAEPAERGAGKHLLICWKNLFVNDLKFVIRLARKLYLGVSTAAAVNACRVAL